MMDDFFDALGAASFSDCGACEMGLGASAGSTMDASLAMSKVVSQYVALSQQGESLRQMLVAGMKVPCDIWLAYANARQDYLTKSQYVFDQLAAKGVTVEQVVYTAGKPKVDPSDPSKVVTLQVAAPLRPPSFVGLNCPDVPNMSGAHLLGLGALNQPVGWEPVPVSLGSISNTVLSALGTSAGNMVLMLMSGGNPLGIAAVGAYKTIKQVAVILEDYDASPSRILAAYTSCFQTSVKAGASTADAAKQCSAVQESAQKSREAVAKSKADAANAGGLGFWGWLGVGAAVFIVGGIVIKVLRSRLATAARLVSPVGEIGEVRRPRRAHYSRPGDPILLGDVYLHPRSYR